MAHRGAEAVCEFLENRKEERIHLPDWVDGDVPASDEKVVLSHNLDELKRTMWDYVGIVRSTKRLERAQSRIRNLVREINEYYWNARVDLPLLEVRNLCVRGRVDHSFGIEQEGEPGLALYLGLSRPGR